MSMTNIAEILKKFPKYYDIYCTFLGECNFIKVEKDYISISHNSQEYVFNNDGTYNSDGDCCLYPSKYMRNWKKLVWNVGDVITDGRRFGIFNGFATPDYTKSKSLYLLEDSKYYTNNDLLTASFHKATKEESEKYIKGLEFYYKKSWNPETLALEEPLPYEKGDFISYDDGDKYYILLLNKIEGSNIYIYAGMTYNGDLLSCNMLSEMNTSIIRNSFTDEAFMLLNKLAERGLSWDIINKKLMPFESFDGKCLMKNDDEWVLCELSHQKDDIYVAVGGNKFKYCIPYNDNTKELLGYNSTSNN